MQHETVAAVALITDDVAAHTIAQHQQPTNILVSVQRTLPDSNTEHRILYFKHSIDMVLETKYLYL